MRKILEKLDHLLFPKLSADELHDMDVESIRNIQHVSGVAAVFEILTLCMYISSVKQFVFSLGYVEGSPNNSEELFVLLCESDLKLYEMKRFTHAPENGGHDRRKARPVTPQ